MAHLPVESIADLLPVGIWVARVPGGELEYANRTFSEILGVEARDDVAVGEYAAPYGICDRSGAPYPEDRLPFVLAVRARETVVVDDIVIHRPDGGRVHVRAQARPVFDAGGEMTHVVIAFIDITREVRAEEARADSEARIRATQRLESIGTLAGGIAHDFNNLLAAVRTLASTLALGEADARRRADLGAIVDVTDHGMLLTRSLLGFAGRGQAAPSVAPVPIDEVVRSIVDILHRTRDRRIEVRLALDAGQLRVSAAGSELEQVVMNLAVNALEAMPEGGTLTLRTSAGPDEVTLEVIDTGVGIPAELRERIFEPYVTTRDRPGRRGAGLGLAVVYGVVQKLAGRIEVADTPGGGTTMRVTLPAVPGPAITAPARRPAPDVVEGTGLVLVIDDEEVVRIGTERALEALGYEVVTAADGLAGVQVFAARHEALCLVLLDQSMPRLDGRETLGRLRAIDPAVPVLLISGRPVDPPIPADGFLPKPFGVQALSHAVAALRRSDPRP